MILFSLQIEHGKVNGSEIEFLPLSFVHIKMINLNMLNVKKTNLNMFDIKVLKSNMVDIDCTNVNFGKISLHVENCSWVNSHRFMDLFQVISVSIVSSKLKTDCHSFSLMNVHGLEYWDYKDWVDYYGIRYLIKHSVSASSTLSLISTAFKVETSLNRIDTELVDIILTDTTFSLTESISFHLTKVLGVKNIPIKCFIGEMAQRMIGDSSVTYTCNPKCEEKSEYSLQEGSLNVSEEIEYNEYGTAPKIWDFPAPLHIPHNPSCLPCPLGVNCKGAIQTMPNYWGYVTPEMSVSVVRCPDSYCCQGGRTCEGIDSCNAGRIGTLCGVCEQNSTEALFTPKCVIAESCRSGLVIALFISAALVYSIVLLPFSTVKKKIFCLFEKGYATCKGRLQKDIIKEKSKTEKKSMEDAETDQGAIKYMQILLYFVQDSKLFTIYLPEMGTKAENFVVKFLEFSPAILTAYIQATELYLAFSSAILHVTLPLSFGFAVMFFLFLVFIISRLLSFSVFKVFSFTSLKVKLVQAFLLTVLFSYQKLVMGAFNLVQCVDIGHQTVLFIQADIQCYTWWQISITVYICTSIFPIFFVLAHAPFHVKSKKMSVRIFIMARLFPVPVLVLYNLVRLWKRRYVSNDLQGGHGIEIVAVPSKNIVQEIPESSNEENLHTERQKVEKSLVETCEGVIVDSLLKHYKCLSVFGIRFTWLGVHKIYRVVLAACRTFMTEPLTRLFAMTALIITMTLFNATIRPYKDQRANTTATISYIANLCVVVLNLMKANYVTFGCDTNSQYRDTVVGYIVTFEDALLLYFPIVAVGLWFVHNIFQKCLGKYKRKRNN